MEKDATKTVIKTLKAYLHEELPLDKDFFNELDSRGLLASANARELAQLADQGKQDCVWKLVTYMEQFYTEEMLQKLCNFLEEYAKPARLKLVTIAFKIRQEILKHKPQAVSLPVPEDPPHHRSAGGHHGDGTSSADMSQHDVYLPVIDDLKTLFSTLAGNVLDIIDSLSDRNWKTFSTNFLLNYLKPSFPPDAYLPVIPETVEDLKLSLIRRWDPLQIALLKAVVEYLTSRKIQDGNFKENIQQVKDELNAYEDLLKSKLPEFLSKCRSKSVSLKPLLGHSSVSVKIASKPEEISLARILKLKGFFINHLGLPDTVFTGFSEGSIVLFFSIPTECVWSLPFCFHPSNLFLLEEWKVLFLSVKGAFTVDIKERRVIDSLGKHSLLSSLAEYKTLNDDLRLRVQYVEKDLHFKEEKLRVMEEEVKALRKGKGKAVTTVQKPPRNWREMKCQKETLECGGVCRSIAVQGDVICVGVEGRVLLFSRTRIPAQFSELGSDQIKDAVYGVAFIDENTIVVSADKRLRTYTIKGQLVSTFDSGKDGFDPHGLTVGPDGHIFVCDGGNHCVCVFNVDGKLLSSFGSKGSGVGQFKYPRDVCMDGEGLLFISDMWNSRICVHSVEGAFIREFPTPRRPSCVAATHCNHLVVSSWTSHTVMIMTTSGQLVHEFGGYGSGPGQFRWPTGVAVDNEDCVYVCDRGNSCVQV